MTLLFYEASKPTNAWHCGSIFFLGWALWNHWFESAHLMDGSSHAVWHLKTRNHDADILVEPGWGPTLAWYWYGQKYWKKNPITSENLSCGVSCRPGKSQLTHQSSPTLPAYDTHNPTHIIYESVAGQAFGTGSG